MGKILLFYKYTSLEYPKRIVKWQKKICDDLNLRGRILIAPEGINGTVGGDAAQVERYKAIMQAHPQFVDIDFKESEGSSHHFPRMQITEKPEVVHLGLPMEQTPLAKTGEHLEPQQVHELIQQKPEDLVILDARNNFEWKIGRFENAITPDIDHFRQFPDYVDNNLEQFKDKQVLMYCTGGIRCERASAYLQSKGVAKKVFQIKGGIHRYAEQFPDGYFRGKNYVFDGRVAVKVTDDVLASCARCTEPCDEYTNCLNADCNDHFICCAACKVRYNNCCSVACQQLLENKEVKPRPQRTTVYR